MKKATRIKSGIGLTWKILKTKKTHHIEDVQNDPDLGPAGKKMGWHCVLGIPLLIDKEIQGVVWFISYKLQKFVKHQVDLFSSITKQLSISISKARLYEDLLSKSRFENIVSSVTQSVHKSIYLEEVFENAVDTLSKEIKDVKHAIIYTIEDEYAILKSHRGFTKKYLERASKIPKPKGLIWKTILDSKPRYVSNTKDDKAIGEAGIEMGIKSYYSVPIFEDDSVIGVLALTSSIEEGFDNDDLSLFEIVAKQLESATTNAKKVELLQRKSKHETIINSITQSVHRSINLNDVLENAIESIEENLDLAVHVSIYLVENDNAVMRAHRGHPDWFIKKVKKIPYSKGFTWKTILDARTIYCPDVDKENAIGPAGRKVGTKSYVAVPLFNNDVVVGALNIHSFEKNSFITDDVNTLEIVGKQISIAIANAQKTEDLQLYSTKLEESNSELKQFAYVASHDLQEPLRMVGSYLGLLERRYKDKLDQDANDFIFYAVDGAKRMQILINDLLSYSRVSTKAKPFESANTEHIVKGALKNLEILIEESGAEVDYKNLPEEIVVDSTQVGQLIQNLVSNAIKFCKDRKPKVEIGVEDREGEWLFSVRDNGIGIDPENYERIFIIFQRLHGKGDYPGTGIGLSICKRIVERHGGKIWVESEQGEGSTFYFTVAKFKEGDK